MTTAGDEHARTLLRPGQRDVRDYGAVTTAGPDGSGNDSSDDTEGDVQDGVRRIEAVSRTWSTWGLVMAYVR
jgi:hypothetical protein